MLCCQVASVVSDSVHWVRCALCHRRQPTRLPRPWDSAGKKWVAIAFSNAWKWKVKVKLLSRVWLLGTPWTAAYQAPLSTGFSRQEYWSGVPLLSPFSSLEEIKDVIMCIPSGGTRTCHKSAQLFFDSSSLSPHPLPSLISNCWIRPLGLPW